MPEFGRYGKRWITIRHVLAHRAGIPNLPPEAMDLELVGHPEKVIDLLAQHARATGRPGGLLQYHAVSGGFILAEVVRRASGETHRDLARARDLPSRSASAGCATACAATDSRRMSRRTR